MGLIKQLHFFFKLSFPLFKDYFSNLFAMSLVGSIVKEAFWAHCHLTLLTIKDFLKALVLAALIFALEYCASNHLFELSYADKLSASLAAFRTARRTTKLTQTCGAHDAGALWTDFDLTMVWGNWQPANEAFDQVVITLCGCVLLILLLALISLRS